MPFDIATRKIKVPRNTPNQGGKRPGVGWRDGEKMQTIVTE